MFKGKYSIPGPKSKKLLKISEEYEAHCMNQQAPIVVMSPGSIEATGRAARVSYLEGYL